MNLVSHPTTWVFVDDEPRFLDSMLAFLPKQQPVVFFDDPHAALNHIESHVEKFDQEADAPPFDLDDARDCVTDRSRFDRVSVVVADFAMPEMNGLQLFERLQNHTLGKVLLTGVADEDTAAAAFNNNVIDRFIKKGSRSALDDIRQYAMDLQGAWFDAYQKAILPTGRKNPLLDKEVINTIGRIFADHNVIEWYFCSKPDGFYCLDQFGKGLFISVVDSDNLEKNFQQAAADGWPGDYLVGLREETVVTSLFESVVDHDRYDWEFNSLKVQKTGDFWIGVHLYPPPDINFIAHQHSFSSYLQESQ